MISWMLSLFKKPDMVMALIFLCGIIFVLIKFLWWVVKETIKVKKEHSEMIANHITHNTDVLDRCSKNMDKLGEEHDKMIEKLIKLNERVK